MQVILVENVERLGARGDIVEVKAGYARNFLIPQNKALMATKGNIRSVQELLQQSASREVKAFRRAEMLARQLQKASCTAVVSVGEDDRLFGSVTTQTIAGLLAEKGFAIDRRQIVLEEPIRSLGIYTIPIRLHAKVEGQIKLWVIKGSE